MLGRQGSPGCVPQQHAARASRTDQRTWGPCLIVFDLFDLFVGSIYFVRVLVLFTLSALHSLVRLLLPLCFAFVVCPHVVVALV